MRVRRSTTIHKLGIEAEVKELLMKKSPSDNFDKYVKILNKKHDVDLTTRQLQYFYNHFVIPHKVITPKDAEKSIEEHRDLINVIVEQMELYQLQLKRLKKIIELEDIENGTIYQNFAEQFSITQVALRDIKNTKQELGLMSKEPEVLKLETHEEISIKDLDPDLLKSLALMMAGKTP